jgi:hypothetical protein
VFTASQSTNKKLSASYKARFLLGASVVVVVVVVVDVEELVELAGVGAFVEVFVVGA